jgi:hypothetical protein
MLRSDDKSYHDKVISDPAGRRGSKNRAGSAWTVGVLLSVFAWSSTSRFVCGTLARLEENGVGEGMVECHLSNADTGAADWGQQSDDCFDMQPPECRAWTWILSSCHGVSSFSLAEFTF